MHTDPHTAELLALVKQIMRESGDDARRFDAPAWLAQWLRSPVPALGGRPPMALLRDADGRGEVRDVLLRM